MKTRTKIIVAGTAVVALSAAGSGIALSSTDDDGTEVPITGVALERATAAALEATGGGTVTETEQGDEESFYEVEVRRLDGSSVDVQLDEDFQLVEITEDSETDEGDQD
ncbi:MAG: PepSY domain-containing protein [Acidimicrobiia bacterium]|nr:PepSY domain-containing protein [Acidimicrobiia bacterium]MBT8217136.1 PepSY domain-containing protein [Acidimicrobiia bacterium]NNF09149.1 PepSY domain-containing protein [Acidimicrobiia bacterium]NNL70496.1 PepSY domain-containing protein [Acidimicrobiia bacterium]